MYPLNMALVAGIGFAAANDEAEHQALTAAGYGPAFVAPDADGRGYVYRPSGHQPERISTTVELDSAERTVESARAALDAAGIAYDKRLGLAKLIALLPA